MRSLTLPGLALSLAGCLVNTELYEQLSEQIDAVVEDEDRDGDGWSGEEDCDDDDPAVHPEADELCNELDDDCDQQVDEHALDAETWFEDVDGDGYGAGDGSAACTQPSGWVAVDGDCHEDDDQAYPGSTAPEFIGDGIDQDCDGFDGCSDLDCDGLPDLVIPSQYDDAGFASYSPLWFGTGDSLGESPHQTLASQGAISAVVDDFDRNGWMDLVFVGYQYDDSYDLDALIYYGGSEGFSDDQRGIVRTSAALDATSADLDHDGWPELIVTSGTLDVGEAIIYWGSADGFVEILASFLPTSGTQRVLVSDLDGDGWEELVFIGSGSLRGYEARTPVYWNREGEFERDDLATVAAYGALDGIAVDFDLDGYQEIVQANYQNEETHELMVSIHHGGPHGYDDGEVIELKSYGACAVDSADLNQDGWPDLVVANYRSDASTLVDSEVFWGSADGVTGLESTPLPTAGAKDIAIADLDDDGWLDLVFANYFGESGTSTDSTIYWGSSEGFAPEGSTPLPTVGAQHVLARDVDQDGWIDLLFTQYSSGTSFEIPSYLYYGSPGGFDVKHREDLLVSGPWGRAVLVGAATPDSSGGVR